MRSKTKQAKLRKLVKRLRRQERQARKEQAMGRPVPLERIRTPELRVVELLCPPKRQATQTGPYEGKI